MNRFLAIFCGFLALLFFMASCASKGVKVFEPKVITQKVRYDAEDPAIWVHPSDPEQSIVFGTDKETEGAVYAFNLEGQIIVNKCINGIKRPNNVDVEYGFALANGVKTDLLVFTERERSMLRVYSVPDMQPLDQGGFPVFEGEPAGDFSAPMGVALYKKPSSGVIYAVVGRKNGPMDGTYLWQYQFGLDSVGLVRATEVRRFGRFSGTKEIEAIAIDDLEGYVYYSEEMVGIRKYYADPDKSNDELALFGQDGFTKDIEGIALLDNPNGGFILVSDQQAQSLRVFQKEGNHEFIRAIRYSALETDGIELSTLSFGNVFPKGMLVAMSDDATYHFYSLTDLGF